MLIKSFKLFCDLADTKSFSKAAKMHGITQSAVSQQMRVLERKFHSRLGERGRNSFRLTREGQVLYDYGKQILQTYESMNSKLQEANDIISGTIRVVSIYSIGLHELPPYIKSFTKVYPTVKVHVEYGRPNQVYEDVLNGVADFGFLAFPVRQPNLEIVPFRMDKLVFICHPQHPFAGQRSVKLNALAGQKFIGFESDIPIRKVVDKMLGSRSVEVQRVTEFDNIESVKRAVEIDAGVSIVPQGTVTQEVVMRTLVALPIEGGKFYRPLGILYKKNKVLSPAMKQFLAVLTAGKSVIHRRNVWAQGER